MPVLKKITLSLKNYKNMAGRSRYSVSGKKAGIKKGVLKNKLGISSQKELDDAETILLSDAYEFFSKKKFKPKDFKVDFLFSIHKYFFGTLYDWAGSLREVNISKGNMMFASARYLRSSLEYLDKILKENFPSRKDSKSIIALKIALLHNEFNAIHPFRDGNGRTIRLFLDLLVSFFGYKMIDWDSRSKNEYLKACLLGSAGNHQPMKDFILRRLKK